MMRLNRFRVLELMEQAGFKTQGELADAIGVSRQALSSWMRGGTFTVDNLAALCAALECTPNDVLRLDDIPKVVAPAPVAVLEIEWVAGARIEKGPAAGTADPSSSPSHPKSNKADSFPITADHRQMHGDDGVP